MPKTRLIKSNIKLANVRVAQSLADSFNGEHLFVVQQSVGALAERRGDLTISKLSQKTWKTVGKMNLKGFGHGVAIGTKPKGFIWVEAAPITRVSGSARGNSVIEVKYKSGSVVKQRKGFTKAGATRMTPSISGNKLGLRYYNGKAYRWATYDLAEAEKGKWVQIDKPVAMPNKRLFQGWCLSGNLIYQLSGKKGQTALLHKRNLTTGKIYEYDTKVKTGEPEGIAVLADGRLVFGVSTGPVGNRRWSLYEVEGF